MSEGDGTSWQILSHKILLDQRLGPQAREGTQELFGGSGSRGRRFPPEFLEVDAAKAADAHAFIKKEALLLSSR